MYRKYKYSRDFYDFPKTFPLICDYRHSLTMVGYDFFAHSLSATDGKCNIQSYVARVVNRSLEHIERLIREDV